MQAHKGCDCRRKPVSDSESASVSDSESASDDGDESASPVAAGVASGSDDRQEESSDGSVDMGVPLINVAVLPTPLPELSRRTPFNRSEALLLRDTYCISDVDVSVDVRGARDFVAIQDKWDEMLRTCKNQFSPVFWRFFLKLHVFPQVFVDTTLNNVRKMGFFPQGLKKGFPSSRRNLMNQLRCIDQFWNIVRHTHRIDLSQFHLLSGTRFLDFQFIDPIWAWLLAARRHHPADLHWKPHAHHAPAHAPVYGGGIQYGECFKHAFEQRPDGSYLMLMALHWDGTFGRSLDVTPIGIGVANINNCDQSKETCIGYMPFTPDQKRPEFAKTAKCTRSMYCV